MHHHRRSAWVFGLIALALVLPARAQTWRGSEAVGVQAANSKGKPIVGARIVFSFQGRGSDSNPPEVATDQKGRAVVAGLATGSWQAEVQHPDFLTYVAVFDLQRGKKPSINASFLEAGGRSLTPMKVKLSKGNPRDASPPLPAREARSQPVPPPEPDRATVEAAPTPPPVETARAPEATIAEEPIAVEPSREEEATPEPEPEPKVQVAEEPLTPSPAESAPTIEEAALPEAQKTRVSDPTPVPVPVPEPDREELTEPPQPSPSTVEPSEPTTAEAEAKPETALEATTIAPEPESQPDTLAEPAVTEEKTPELESSLVAEAVDEIPEVRAPPPSEPESIAPEPVEDEPAIELTQVTEAPVEHRPLEAPPEPTVQPVVPSEVTAEAPRQEPLSEVVGPAAERVEVEEPPAQQPEAPVVEKVAPPRTPAPPVGTVIPGDAPTISSYRDGSCSECRTGEWAVTATQTIAAGSVACPAEATPAARDAADRLGNSTQLELSGFVGPAADGSSIEALTSVEPEISQAYRQQLSPYLGGASNCQVVSVVLPKSVRFAGFRYEAFDGDGGGDCAPDRGCLLSRAQWLDNPVVQRGFNATVVWGIFENTAEDKPRFARLKAYFRPPNGRWEPPTQ